MAVLSTQPSDWLCIGLVTVGFNSRHQKCCHDTNMRRFREHFGASPETHTAIFADLQTTNIAAARIAKPSVKYLLMAMYWLKTYSTESEMAGTFKVDEKMAQKHVWKYVHAIRALNELKARVSFNMLYFNGFISFTHFDTS